MVNLPTKFEVYLTGYGDIKRKAKCTKWGGMG